MENKYQRKLFSFLSKIRIDILIIIGCFAIISPFFFNKPVRVGDGSEYYAMALAWGNTNKPSMTDLSWQAYDNLAASGEITGLVNGIKLKNSMPVLPSEERSDFIHFWFYSLCAAVIYKFGLFTGLNISIHNSFILFHCLLLASMFLIAWRCFGWKGLIATIILTFLSPIIWYFNKVHTELFTFCVTTSAVILFLKKRYFPSALFLALASTQNISFSAVSLGVLGFGVISQYKGKYSAGKIISIMLTISILSLQPVYYYLQYGIFSPLISAGGAKIGNHLKYAYIWLFDPDVGLFPNWLPGIIIVVLSIYVFIKRKPAPLIIYRWLAFTLVYTGISLWAQSSTTNLNAGATTGLARYALWYLALFFPAILLLLYRTNFSGWVSIFSLGIFIVGIVLNFQYNNPGLNEKYISPSPISMFIQKYLPNLYNPPPEIFAERYGGIGESAHIWDSIAVMGPDCRKFLFINRVIPENKQVILGGKGCGFDYEKLAKVLEQKNNLIKSRQMVYNSINDNEFKESVYIPQLKEWLYTTIDGKAIGMLDSGWSISEKWGTWTDETHATLKIPCPVIDNRSDAPLILKLEIKPLVAPEHPYTAVTINTGKVQAWSGRLDKLDIIKINLPEDACSLRSDISLNILIDNPVSPSSLGFSSDQRKLGIGLIRIRIDIANTK